jgi:two-component system phosphate regulon sensor histidine kinase PhoR
MENHKERPEFQKALYSEFGENIRHSATTNKEYIYYAKSYKNYVVRAAILYDTEIKAFLKADRIFIPFFIVLFLVFGFLLRYIANHIGDSITKLKDFAVKIRRNQMINIDDNTQFPNDELGFISQEIIQLYQQLRQY